MKLARFIPRADLGMEYTMASLRSTLMDDTWLKAVISVASGLVGMLVGAIDQVVLSVLGLWALDMVAGTAQAFAEHGWKGIRIEKARAGFMRGAVYLCTVAGMALAANALANMGGPSLSPGVVWAVCGWVAAAELMSIGRHAQYFWPGIGEVFGRVAAYLPRKPDDEP